MLYNYSIVFLFPNACSWEPALVYSISYPQRINPPYIANLVVELKMEIYGR